MKILTREDLRRIPEKINFPEEEENILRFWNTEQIFAKCMKASKTKPHYNFFDGPPFATGLPHYGHILAGTIKDVVTRYAYQQGYHVERRFGWDCHGLPVEYEIDKTLNIKGPEDVAKMGIKTYNAECRKIVMRYADEWEKIINRMGRWIDFKNDYKTLYPWYMESIWWVFKQLFEKGLVYQGNKVMPYSTACTTALSNFESGQNYKEVVDPCVVVAFEIIDKPGEYFLIWTTTPWTLPSNYAVCVNPSMIYVKAKLNDKVYILAECRLSCVFKKDDKYEILEKFPGSTLKDMKYKPAFSYFEERGRKDGAFRVLVDGYVTQDSGTGIVHNAPYFGEDDYRICMAAGIITKESEPVCPLDDVGRFTSEVSHFAGQYIKDADKNIMAHLKQQGSLFSSGQVKHNYPFCWRSDTPLVYRAVPSWFIRVEQVSENLLACSASTYWVPENVKDKRFGNWLREARDWAVSRNRYWGTPIPIWKSDDNKEIICVGSIFELQTLSGQKITDLHRENIDHITIPSKRPGQPPLKRVKEVFDCWFESGSMPYAQQHFPFENEKDFMTNFPADFIAEGIDQTRGWFYTLLVLSTLLFNKPPFKNLIANGLVLASDGQKMSKRKKNYPDPLDVVHKYGADSLRLYLINSPVVRAENLRFKEEGVRDVIKDVFLPWYNAFRFLLQNVARLEIEDKIQYTYDQKRHLSSLKDTSIMDVWILSFKESLLAFFDKEMKGYRLYTVVPRLTKFIDQLTNWYVRLNRRRLKGEEAKSECLKSLDTLYDVLFSMVKMMAPFTPFLAEYIYKRLVLLNTTPSSLSVHLEMMPKSNRALIHENVEIAVNRMQSVIELGRIIRDRRTMPLKYPLTKVIVIHKDEKYLTDIMSLKDFIKNELNILDIFVTTDKAKYGVSVRAEPNHKTLGVKLKGDFKAVMAGIKNLTNDEIETSLAAGKFTICGHNIDMEDIRVIYCVSDKIGQQFEAHSDNDVLVLMDMTPNQELMEQGLAREIINRIQKLKKKAQLVPTDLVQIQYTVPQKSELNAVAKKYEVLIESVVKSKLIETAPKGWFEIINKSYDLQGTEMKITIFSEKKLVETGKTPLVPWVNLVKSNSLENRYVDGKYGTVLLQRANGGGGIITVAELRNEIEKVFGLQDQKFILKDGKGIIVPEDKNVKELSGSVIFVAKNDADIATTDGANGSLPFVEFLNNGNKTVLLENPKGVKLAS